jgi:uncharacterized protein (DUF697 family)
MLKLGLILSKIAHVSKNEALCSHNSVSRCYASLEAIGPRMRAKGAVRGSTISARTRALTAEQGMMQMPDGPIESNSGALTKLNQVFDWAYGRAIEGILDDSGAEEFAREYLRSHPDPDAAIDALIQWQMIKAGSVGFVTGIGGVFTLPVAIPANLAALLYIQLKMIAAIAHIRGHDLKTDGVKGLAIACLVGSSAIEVLKEVGISIGSKLTAQAVKNTPRALIITLNHVVGCRLMTKAGTKGIVNLSRVIPIVGGLVSGAFDAGATRAIADAAKNLFTDIPPATSGMAQQE